MKLVLDASMALSWIFERIKKEEAECSDKLLLKLSDAETFVPSLWHTEITNALLVGERRHIVTEAQTIDYLNRLSQLPIITDEIPSANRRDLVMSIAREYELTTYDATYLDLALRTGSVIATFDTKLKGAMQRAGGSVFQPTT